MKQTLLLALTATSIYSASASGGTRGAINRIVGGDETSFGSYTFYVGLTGPDVFCGGSLIHEDIVLSAAHCNVARFGEVGPSTAKVGARQIPIRILSGTEHPRFSNVTYEFDLMVLKLERSVEGVSPIELESSEDNESSDPVLVIGMGVTAERSELRSSSLQEVTLPYVPRDVCQEQYPSFPVTNSMVCAGGEVGMAGCRGDSGGPAIQGNRQVGVTSWSVGCARANRPTVFARVASAHDWIQEMVCCLSSNPPDSCGDVDKSQCPDDLGLGLLDNEFFSGGEVPWDHGSDENDILPLLGMSELVALIVAFVAVFVALFLVGHFWKRK